MGCDIHGYVEVDYHRQSDDHEPWWMAAGQLLPFVGRAYDSFGCMFGVSNYAQFDPIAADRGIPSDASRTTREDYESWGRDAHSATYLTYEEAQAIDWDETAEEPDERYTFLDENKEPTGGKAGGFGPVSGWYDALEDAEQRERLAAGEPVPNADGSGYLQRRVMTREDALSGAWEWFLDDHMGLLADRFGENAVRVVVWFDN